MKIRYTRRALADLDQISDYLTPRSTKGAQNVRAAILASVEDLAVFPRMGRLQTAEPMRKIAVRPYPYLIYYTVDDAAGEIAIATIQHGYRKREFTDR